MWLKDLGFIIDHWVSKFRILTKAINLLYILILNFSLFETQKYFNMFKLVKIYNQLMLHLNENLFVLIIKIEIIGRLEYQFKIGFLSPILNSQKNPTFTLLRQDLRFFSLSE